MARPSSPDSDCSYFRNGPWGTEKSENEEISHPTGLRDRKRIQITIPCTRIVGMKREREGEGEREKGGKKRIPVDSVLKSHDLRRLYPPGKWDREGHDRINVFVARPLFLSLDQPASQPGTLLSTWKFAPTTFRQHCGHRFLVGTGEECGRYCFPLLKLSSTVIRKLSIWRTYSNFRSKS